MMKMRSLAQLKMMGRNLICKRMKIYTANITYNSCLYVSSRNYHNVLATVPNCFKSTTRHASTFPRFSEKREQLLEEHKVIRKGDVINLQNLLFTEYRDYVVRHNDFRVKAAQLAGKVVVLYFLPLHHDPVYSKMSISYLTDTYTYLLPDNVFEVVVVAYGTADDMLLSDSYKDNQSNFESIFYHMPWTAIPFPDITSRERLVRRFGIDRVKCYSTSVVIDSSGLVLQSSSCKLFQRYGALGYPFSDERIEYIKAQDDATAKKPSLKALLSSPKRDYLISNKGDKVLIDTLAEKDVALYFYEEGITPDWLTANIKRAYKELVQSNSCFEVVLIYLYSTSGTIDETSEESFWNTFETMPWLALPFRDPRCERLMHCLGYPHDWHSYLETLPTLVIIGAHGKFIEPHGADIIGRFKLPALPTRESVVKLETEKVRELTLDMLWDRNTFFRGKDGSKVQFSQLVGKRIILFFEGNDWRGKGVGYFLNDLKEMYLDMKGTSDEFEVIYITNGKKQFPDDEHITDVPSWFVPSWFVSLASELLPINLSLYCCYCHLLSVPAVSACRCGSGEWRRRSSILAFDQDGRAVRKSLLPNIINKRFPFYCGSMEKEAFRELRILYNWEER